jgi:hypothetical protein
VGHGCARELGVRAGSAARPSHPRARAAAAQVGAVRRCGEGKGGEEKRSEADERVPRVSEGKEKDEDSDGLGCGARRPIGLVGLVGLVG